METTPCPHCDAPLRPAATFCLACDRPVVPETSRLSVGEPVHVQMGRPLVGLAVLAAVLVAVGGTAYGAVAFVRHQRAASTAQVVGDITRGSRILTDAEGGDAAACRRTAGLLAGPGPVVSRQCAAIVDRDPGVRVDKVLVDHLHLQGATGTARVRETVTDGTGTRTVDRTVELVRRARAWRLGWDGHPFV